MNIVKKDRIKIKLRKFIKQIIDRLGAFVLVIIFLPLWIIIALAIKLDDQGAVLHRRRVMGKGGTQFDAFKFRTMVQGADEILRQNPAMRLEFEKNFKLVNDTRVTSFGRVLRRTSIDEFPQLLNVLKGQMSLVGPRMISPEELSKYGDQAQVLLSVDPGCSGLWVVSGRQDIPYEQRIMIELSYINNWSLGLDIKIIMKTIVAIISLRGAY